VGSTGGGLLADRPAEFLNRDDPIKTEAVTGVVHSRGVDTGADDDV